jgi:glutamyl-tRNA reductase
MTATRSASSATMSGRADPLDLMVIGVSYKSAPVAVRERVAVAGEEREGVLHQLRADPRVREAMIVSTCNRVEIYIAADDDAHVAEHAKHVLASRVPS